MPDADDICTCGHTVATHEPMYESLAYLKAGEPCAWRCTVSDGCMDFKLWTFTTAVEEHHAEAGRRLWAALSVEIVDDLPDDVRRAMDEYEAATEERWRKS